LFVSGPRSLKHGASTTFVAVFPYDFFTNHLSPLNAKTDLIKVVPSDWLASWARASIASKRWELGNLCL
jgi:hypothetical protein